MRLSLARALAAATALTLTSLAIGGSSVNTDLLDPNQESPGLSVGDAAPDVQVVTTSGEKVDFASLYAEGPLVVTFYRGGWCPHCNRALKDWAGRYDELTRAGARFIAITPEKPENAEETLEKVEAGYRVFIDPEGDVGKAFRVQFQVDDKTKTMYKKYGLDVEASNVNGRWELPAPATFVIDTEGVIRWVHADWNYRADARADPDEVIAAVSELK